MAKEIAVLINLLILAYLKSSQALQCYSCGWDLETSSETEEVREKCWHETPKTTVDCAQSSDPVSVGSDVMIGCYSLMANMSEEKREFGRGCMTDEFYNCTAILLRERLESGDCTKFLEDNARVCFRNETEGFKVTKLLEYTICYCSSGDLCNTEDGAKGKRGKGLANNLTTLSISLKGLVALFTIMNY